MNVSDQCANTPPGAEVDANGCTTVQGVELLEDLVQSADSLSNGNRKALEASLKRATSLLEDDNPRNDGGVCGKLQEFLDNVDDFQAKGTLSAEEADQMREAAEGQQVLLSC